MPGTVVVGAQWGDEGKGKIIDILASKADVVVRSQGGNNAGHTVEYKGEVYKLHLIPSGILYEDTLNLVGSGVVIDPKDFLTEINDIMARGSSCENLKIDPRAHVIMPWHITLDILSEKRRGGNEIGTTRKGIGPCYMDKIERIGLRVCDLINPEVFEEKARLTGKLKNEIIEKIYDGEAVNIEETIEKYKKYGKRLKKYVADVSVLTYEAIKADKKVLFEGAQGTLLDIDMGTYPYVTSSHPVSGGICVGTGIGPTHFDAIIGVSKAYTTRVGRGPFPTELDDETGDLLRQKGNEFGTTTGRPRRTGWFDAVILRHSVRINGLTGLAVNKLDTLSDIGSLKVCVAYKKPDGTVIKDYPPSLEELAECKPVYEEFEGFTEDISRCQSYEQLPVACKRYIEELEKICECPITMVGVGPSREQNLKR